MATKGTKNKKIEAVEAKAVLDAVKDLDLNTVVTEISGLQVSIQNTLAGLSATLTNKVQQLQQADAAIDLKEQRLTELFQIEKEAVSLDELKAQKVEEDMSWERKRLDRDAAWEEEAQERDKTWKRTEEEHHYSMTQAQKRSQDEFAALLSQNQRNEKIRQEALQKTWEDRDNALKSREKEFTDLKTQVDGFDAKMKAEVSKAEAIVGNSMKRQYDHEVALLKKDMESERNLNVVKITALEDTIDKLENQIATLQVQLAAARTDAKEVATQALQSASGRQVVDALQRAADSKDQIAAKTK